MRRPKDLAAAVILHTTPTEKFRVGGHRRYTIEKTVAADLEKLGVTTPFLYNHRGAWTDLCDEALL